METNVMNPVPQKEMERVIELSDLELDYSELDEKFSDLTKLAAKVAGTDVSLINLIDTFTQWTVAKYGYQELSQMPRDKSICQYTIMDDMPMEVSDINNDGRFPHLREDPYFTLNYYYGIPLKTKNGHNIGALCVLHDDETNLTPEKIEMLKIISNEIVERLVSLKEIKELKKELAEAKQDKKKLSHDIRGPLGGIVGLAQIIGDQIKANELSDIFELTEMIRKGGNSLLELAEDILSKDHSRKENEEPKDYEFNLNTLKSKLEQLFMPQAAAKDIDLVIANDSANAEIPFSKQKIIQIIGNLISNAIKFTPEEGIVMIRQEFIKGRDKDHLKFTVKDSGEGVSEEKIQQIQNGNAKSTTGTDGEVGYGFGLSLVKHLIDGMEGKFYIESKKGEGCKFDVILPV